MADEIKDKLVNLEDLKAVKDTIDDMTTGINLLRGTRDFTLGSQLVNSYVTNSYIDGFPKYDSAYTKHVDEESGFSELQSRTDVASSTSCNSVSFFITEPGTYTWYEEVKFSEVPQSDFYGYFYYKDSKNYTVKQTRISFNDTNIKYTDIVPGRWYQVNFKVVIGDGEYADEGFGFRQFNNLPTGGAYPTYRKFGVYKGAINNPIYSESPFDHPSIPVPVSQGGTGAPTSKAAQYNLFKDMNSVNTDASDSSAFIMDYGTDSSETKGKLVVRKANYVWNWIASKIKSVFGFNDSGVLSIEHGGTGIAATNNTKYLIAEQLKLPYLGDFPEDINKIQPTTDLNTLTTPGKTYWYAYPGSGMPTNAPNTPKGMDFRLYVSMIGRTNVIAQTIIAKDYYGVYGNANKIYLFMRSRYDADNWSDWTYPPEANVSVDAYNLGMVPEENRLGANADLNDYNKAGTYCCVSNATTGSLVNIPSTLKDAFKLYVEYGTGGNTNYVKQWIRTYGSVTNDYYRYSNDGGNKWESWKETYSNIPTRPIEGGGTGSSNAKGARNNLFGSDVTQAVDVQTDDIRFLHHMADNSNRVTYRTGPQIWKWIKSKIEADGSLGGGSEIENRTTLQRHQFTYRPESTGLVIPTERSEELLDDIVSVELRYSSDGYNAIVLKNLALSLNSTPSKLIIGFLNDVSLVLTDFETTIVIKTKSITLEDEEIQEAYYNTSTYS